MNPPPVMNRSGALSACVVWAALAATTAGCNDDFRRNRAVEVLDLAVPQGVDLARPSDGGGGDGGDLARDLALPTHDAAGGTADLATARDLAPAPDLAIVDLSTPADLNPGKDLVAMQVGPISGGPCLSGVAGATGLRLGWVDGGGRATMQYEVQGMPDKGNVKAGVYGYQIGFVPVFADPFLGPGGLQLDGSSFIDINLSTVGINVIKRVTLSLYGRSYSVGSSGSFSWQTQRGVGATPANSVSNVAPYHWDSGDITAVIDANDQALLLRIKAGPNSGSLVVRRLELCFDAT